MYIYVNTYKQASQRYGALKPWNLHLRWLDDFWSFCLDHFGTNLSLCILLHLTPAINQCTLVACQMAVMQQWPSLWCKSKTILGGKTSPFMLHAEKLGVLLHITGCSSSFPALGNDMYVRKTLTWCNMTSIDLNRWQRESVTESCSWVSPGGKRRNRINTNHRSDSSNVRAAPKEKLK